MMIMFTLAEIYLPGPRQIQDYGTTTTQGRHNQSNNALANRNYSFGTIDEITRWTIIRSLPPVRSFCDDENMDCPICMEAFKKGELIQPFGICNHKFHISCLFLWLGNEGKTTCPICRKNLFY
jgi:hypothetical protein